MFDVTFFFVGHDFTLSTDNNESGKRFAVTGEEIISSGWNG